MRPHVCRQLACVSRVPLGSDATLRSTCGRCLLLKDHLHGQPIHLCNLARLRSTLTTSHRLRPRHLDFKLAVRSAGVMDLQGALGQVCTSRRSRPHASPSSAGDDLLAMMCLLPLTRNTWKHVTAGIPPIPFIPQPTLALPQTWSWDASTPARLEGDEMDYALEDGLLGSGFRCVRTRAGEQAWHQRAPAGWIGGLLATPHGGQPPQGGGQPHQTPPLLEQCKQLACVALCLSVCPLLSPSPPPPLPHSLPGACVQALWLRRRCIANRRRTAADRAPGAACAR